jgi:hypothetical protein
MTWINARAGPPRRAGGAEEVRRLARAQSIGGAQSNYFSSACHVHFSPLTFHALPLMCVPEIRPCRSLNL